MSQLRISEGRLEYFDTEEDVNDYIEVEAERLEIDLENSKCYMDKKTRDFIVSDLDLNDKEYMYLCDYGSR